MPSALPAAADPATDGNNAVLNGVVPGDRGKTLSEFEDYLRTVGNGNLLAFFDSPDSKSAHTAKSSADCAI